MPRHSTQARETRTCQVCNVEFLFYPCPSFVKRGYGRFCSPACCYASRAVPLIDRFFRYVGRKTTTGCILWAGLTNWDGYGILNEGGRKGKVHTASRVSYELFVGPIPGKLLVLHRCDNPPCINPVHLFLGTQADNLADMVAKGRARKRTPGSRRYLRDLRAGQG